MRIILNLDDGDWDTWFVKEDKISAFVLGPGMEFPSDDDPSLGQRKLLPNLGMDIPSRALQGGGDVFGADVAFGKGAFIHGLSQGVARY